MTSDEFEIVAKNAVVNELKNYGIYTDISKLDFFCFAHKVGHKKCTIWGPPMRTAYAEVTYKYKYGEDELYVDIYQKISNKKIPSSEFNFSATKENK